MLPSVLLPALLLLACPSKDGDDDDDDGGGDDTGDGGTPDGGGDGGSGDGGGGDGGGGDGGGGDGGSGDGGSGDGGACPDYAGFGSTGTKRTYGTTASYEAVLGGTGQYSMTTISKGEGEVELRFEDDYDYDSGARSSSSGSYVFHCDDTGAYAVSLSSSGSYTSADLDYTWSSTTTYTDPAIGVVWDVMPGDTWVDAWRYSASGETSTGGPWSSTEDGVVTTRIDSASAVTVPAGTFEVVRFTSDNDVGGETSSSNWYANAEVGMVKNDYFELTSVE